MTDLDAVRDQVAILQFCRTQRIELEARVGELEAAAKAAIQDVMGDDDTGVLDGETVATWKSHKRTALNQKLLAQLHPDVYEECRETTEVRRFELR